ncbi:MAG: sugar phosphate isomerase/epimerase [Actinomycetota bacterium]
MPERLLSLAAGTVPELTPVEIVSVAAEAGWPATGLWFDGASWNDDTTRGVRRALDDTGIRALDLEPIFITPDGDHGERLIDVAASVGASNLLAVGLGIEAPALIGRLGELGDRAADAGVTVALEFGRLFATHDLGAALDVVGRAGSSGLAVLVDALHLARSGGSPDDVSGVDPALLPYVQVCDATAEPTSDLRADALDDRLLPGDGELPLSELVALLPAHTALSVELRSAQLRADFEPLERARRVLAATRSLASL